MRIKINYGGLRRYREQIKYDLKHNTDGPIRRVLKKWAARYRSFLQLRYERASRGSGIWKALKPATMRAKGSSSILIDTGTLRVALNPQFSNLPGQLERHGPNFVMTGYGPGGHVKANMSIQDLAEIHQLGKGNNPQRKIVVPPDQKLAEDMAEDMRQGLVELGRITGVN